MIDSASIVSLIAEHRSARMGAADRLATEALYPIAHHATSDLALRDGDERDELVQVAVVAMWERIESVESHGNPYAYLRRVARTRALSSLRRLRRAEGARGH